MSAKYDEYLMAHIGAVQLAGEWMMQNGIVPFERFDLRRELSEKLRGHDASKRSIPEYEAYDDYYYGEDKDDGTCEACFNYAWLHHIHQNPHHWQYWLLQEDEGKTIALEMPEVEVYHMIADWWSFSWRADKLDEIFKWYAEHEKKMVLHPKTRRLVERTLDQIRELI